MDLFEKGILKFEAILDRRFNNKTIGKIARCESSNACEGFFGTVMQFLEGKRLNLDQTDIWKVMLELAFCRYGDASDGNSNVGRTHTDLTSLLGLNVTSVEEKYVNLDEKIRRKRQGAQLQYKRKPMKNFGITNQI